MTLLLALWTTLSTPAVAQDAEVIVVSNAFARWDDTRWYVRTQVSLPWSAAMYAERNVEVAFAAYDVELVIHCQLADKLGKHAHDAICDVEDASLRMSAWSATTKGADTVMAETVPRIKDLKLRMRVFDDGRVGGVVLEGEPESYRRVNILYENLRQLVNRAIAGFHADGPKALKPGTTWIDNVHPLFDVPMFLVWSDGTSLPPAKGNGDFSGGSGAGDGSSQASGGGGGLDAGGSRIAAPTLQDGSGNTLADDAGSRIAAGSTAMPLAVAGPTPIATPASISSCTVDNQVNLLDGHMILQSVGTGGVTLSTETTSQSLRGDLSSVAVFSTENGYMSERLWAVTLSFTAGSGGLGAARNDYWSKGTLRQLDKTEQPTLLSSGYVTGPGQTSGGLPPWPEM